MTLFGQPVVLAIDKRPRPSSLSELAARVSKIRDVAGLPVLYATGSLASYERKRLIEHKVPFVVPGNQLYLPDLGLDLREHFRRAAERTPDTRLSPSTQALLIAHLLARPWEPVWHPATAARALNYTPMTASRAANELVVAGLAEAQNKGRVQLLAFKSLTPQEVWGDAAPALRSPILRSAWLPHRQKGMALRMAGTSALARHSLLNEPRHPVYAVERKAWLASKEKLIVVPEQAPGAIEVQVWSYSPALLADSEEVDPLSLIVSLRDEKDDRVQMALKEFEEALPW